MGRRPQRTSIALAVNFCGVERKLVAKFQGDRSRFSDGHGPIETRVAAGVTCATSLLNLDPDRVLVAIDAHLDDALKVAGAFTFAPEFAARPREVPRLPGGYGLRQRVRVHVRDHEHRFGTGVGSDTSDESVGAELRR